MKNIWISGSINSGKSIASKILSKKLEMVVIELDSFSDFVDQFMDFDDYIKLNYDIVSEIVEIYNKRGYGVIVVYPISEKKGFELKNSSSNFIFFTLDPGLEIALTNRGEGELSDWERGRIIHHYENGVNNLSFGFRVNTKNLTPEETVNEIVSLLKKTPNQLESRLGGLNKHRCFVSGVHECVVLNCKPFGIRRM